MGEPPRVLVVDDDAGIRDLLDLALADAGYAVALAADGAVALALVDAVAPDVILLDMRMPVLDGWAFAEAYRRRPGRRAPIVAMTAARDAPGSAAQIAATGYLAKPFDLADLLACVARYSPSHE
jgi:two-component system, chemotaxis family, chemotaxis protein CheY